MMKDYSVIRNNHRSTTAASFAHSYSSQARDFDSISMHSKSAWKATHAIFGIFGHIAISSSKYHSCADYFWWHPLIARWTIDFARSYNSVPPGGSWE